VGVVTRLRQVALVVIAGGAALVGVWAQGFPRSFYDDFPGAGRVWVAVDGPFNEHLVRDVGGLNLGLAFVAVLALVTGSVVAARAAGGAALLYGVPHLAYHALHLDGFDTADAVGMLVSLSLTVLAAVAALTAPTPTASVDASARMAH
jgi:tRNA U34 5-methylaminomethyl-2-thiouridine-forming methyltransferase MnmC